MSALVVLAAIFAANPAPSPFAITQEQNITAPSDFGIINEKITAGIDYTTFGAVRGLWSPPYVSSDFQLTVSIDGKSVPCADYIWEPFSVTRRTALEEATLEDICALLYGQRAGLLHITIRNEGSEAREFTISIRASGTLDETTTWEFARAQSATQTAPVVQENALLLEQGPLAVVVQGSILLWEANGAGDGKIALPGGGTKNVDIAFAIGPREEALAACKAILADPAAALDAAQSAFARRRQNLFDKLPVFESSDPALTAFYNRSLVHLLTNRWDIPQFALQPYYSTGSILGGCVCEYLWNFGEVWEILPLFDPDAAREHIKQFLKVDITEHFAFMPITGEAFGPWYPVNQEKIIGLIYYYVALTGDIAFLEETVAGKTVLDWVIENALCRDDPAKPVALVDYGPSNSHLELRRGYPYNHVMPDLNGRRYLNYLRAADLADAAQKPRPELRERAAALKALLKERLWNPETKWFDFLDENGNRDRRLTIQMFKLFASGVLDGEEEAGLLSHLNETEFLSAEGLHSMAKTDIAYDQVDIDNGGGGNCTSFPPQIVERLYRAGYPSQADDILRRILWWGGRMPYWGDSIVANSIDYRRDTPLQCTLDGAAIAQCLIFGLAGIEAAFNGDISFTPHCPAFTNRFALHHLQLRGVAFDLVCTPEETRLSTGTQTLPIPAGQSAHWTAATQALQLGHSDKSR